MGKTVRELVKVGEDASDPHVQCWGHNGLGTLKGAIGPLDEAAASLSRTIELSIKITSLRFQTGAGGALGRCRLRQGREAEAEALLLSSLNLAKAKNLRGVWSSDIYIGLTELWLNRAEREKGALRRGPLRQARKFARLAYGCTRDGVGWFPATLRLLGRLAWLTGDVRSARQHWERSLAVAQSAGNALERSRTLLEMGVRLGDTALIEHARHMFEQSGARVDLAFCLHALARIAAATPADTGEALQHYDHAIAALDAVKAEYNLGLACRERAELLTKHGRHHEARADLQRADQCFAAVKIALAR
jgi:tetratricopeptide (TPR) repeat protein